MTEATTTLTRAGSDMKMNAPKVRGVLGAATLFFLLQYLSLPLHEHLLRNETSIV